MGYTTDFYGEVTVSPPLNEEEQAFLHKFAEICHMDRESGPYFLGGSGSFGQGDDSDIRDPRRGPEGQPGFWCQWVPNEDGTAIEWNGGEKFYDAETWMAYLIDHFLRPGAEAGRCGDPQFERFSFDHTAEGEIEAQGEEIEDKWLLRVEANKVSVLLGRVVYEPEPPETFLEAVRIAAELLGERPIGSQRGQALVEFCNALRGRAADRIDQTREEIAQARRPTQSKGGEIRAVDR